MPDGLGDEVQELLGEKTVDSIFESEQVICAVSDDAKPIDDAWLRSVGFLSDGTHEGKTLALTLWYGRNEDEVAAGTDEGRHILIDEKGDAMIEEFDSGGRVTSCVTMPNLPTRGDVRRLCAALGESLQ